MGWHLRCTVESCEQEVWANNVVDLIINHRDGSGWFRCPCGSHSYVRMRFPLQEPGEVWEPYLRGVIPLGKPSDTYQPFVFLVSYEPDGEVTALWFSYYKDLRPFGGRLKLGYGPGGPPVLDREGILNLLSQLMVTKFLTKKELLRAVAE